MPLTWLPEDTLLPDPVETSYQSSLRMLGSRLDDEAATGVRVIEVVYGFVVHYRRSHQPNDYSVVEYRSRDLLSLREQRKRRMLRGILHTVQNRYENIFRALGYELDQETARNILLEEVDEGYLLTYQAFNPAEGTTPRKHLRFLDQEEQEKVLAQAVARRRGARIRTLRELFAS